MRIIGGVLKGQRLLCPRGQKVRPTTDRAKEALFQILEARHGFDWPKVQVMDLFAGSGALGIEALSRRARRAFFVERDRQALYVIEKNLESCRLGNKATLIRQDVFSFLRRKAFKPPIKPVSLVLADPPYGKGYSKRLLDLIARTNGLVANGGIIVVEEDKRADLLVAVPGSHMKLELLEKRSFGDTAFFFYSATAQGEDNGLCPE